jgi:tRNA(fMet)-specific endonuclease VapC
MPAYMLDTESVSFALRGQGRVGERILERRPSELCISSVTLAKLRYGAEERRSKKLHGLISTFADSVEVLPFDDFAATRSGVVAAVLARKGSPLGTFDIFLAAHALSLDLTLVTGNEAHFGRVPELRTENWI